MSKPIVAIVGRPNVGKSTLFNRLCGARISIVEDTPGVTRDRIYGDVEWLRHKFTLIDTGGLEPESDDFFLKEILKQAEVAIEMADVIVFVVDTKTGATDTDTEVANILRRAKKPIVLAANKVDTMAKYAMDAYEFYSLGLGDPVVVSSGQALGLGDLLDEIVKHFPQDAPEEEDEDIIKVAVVGKPNVGKSSLINRILGEERVIVSDIPGTTRDAVDTYFEKDGQKFMFIDTAGMRRKSRVRGDIERFSVMRAVAAVERADVCVILIDASEGFSEQDTKIAGIAHESGKAAIFAVNKWDLIEKDDKTMNKYIKEIEHEFVFMTYAPSLFISVLTGQRVNNLFAMIHSVWQNASMRVSTGLLNDVLIEAIAVNEPPGDRGRQLKVYYATQVSVRPPTFVLFVNDSALMHFSYKRYLENKLREAFGFKGTPVRFVVRNKGGRD